jgi:hypothetical protein
MSNSSKRCSLIALAAGLAVAVSALAAQGQSIYGTINFTGGAVLNGPLKTASTYNSYFGSPGPLPEVLGGSQTGAYQFVPAGTQVTIDPFSFEPYNPSSALSIPLWSFSVGATQYSFTATSILFVRQATGFLNVQGSGIASITGYADTAATWSFTDTGSGAGPSFNFGGSMAVAPEPFFTSLVVAVSLAGYVLLGIRRKPRLA